MRPSSISAVLATSLALTALFASRDAQADKKPTKKSGAKSGASGGPRKDPKGIQGVAPYQEALGRGHAMIAARDLPSAIAAYQDAITQDPENPSGHYFLGAARVMKNELSEGTTSFESAVRLAGKSDEIQAKALFQLADIKERQDKLDDAKKAWDTYIAFVEAHPKAKGYPQSGAERIKAADKRLAIVKSAAEVKARIEKRLKEVGGPPPDDGPQGPGTGKKK